MSDEERKRSKSRVLRFAVTSALLVGPAGGCGPEPVEHNTPAPADRAPEGDGPQLPDTQLPDMVEQRTTNSPVQVEQERPTNAPMQETPPSDSPPPVVGNDPLEGVTEPRGTNAPAPRTDAPDPVEGR